MSQPKRLYRDVQEAKVGGVCSGLADYLGMDPALVRILYVVALIFTAVVPLVLVYLAMWALVPAKPPLPPGAAPAPVQQS